MSSLDSPAPSSAPPPDPSAPSTASDSRSGTGASRRRLAGLAVVLLAVGAVIAAAVFAFRGEDTPDTISLGGAEAPETSEPVEGSAADEDESASSESASDGTSSSADGPAEGGEPAAPAPSGDVPPSVEVVAGTRIDIPASAVVGDEPAELWDTSIVPWQDGFLMTGTIAQPQVLPELPPEIAERFPEEVVTFFEEAGGLPPTIQEAVEMLSAEPGLMDLVNEVVLDDPEVSAAIYAEPVAPPSRYTLLSSDGVEWTEVDVAWPALDGYSQSLVASDGRSLVHVAREDLFDPEQIEPGPPTDTSFTVSTTTDLETWTSAQFVVDSGGSGPRADGVPVQRWTDVSGVALSGDRWVVVYSTHEHVDTYALLPDEALELMNSEGSSMGEDETGITIYHHDFSDDPADQPIEIGPDTGEVVLTYTWEELGLDGPPYSDAPLTSTVAVGVVGSDDTLATDHAVPFDGGFGPGGLMGTPDGFVRASYGELFVSADGLSWTPVFAGDRLPTSVVESPLGPIALVPDLDALRADSSLEVPPLQAYLVDVATASATPVPAPNVSVDGGWSHVGSAAVVYSSPSFESSTSVIEKDGFRIEATFRAYVTDHVVTDLADGTVVLEATVTWDEDGPIRSTPEGWAYDIPGRDEPLVLTYEDVWNEQEPPAEPETYVEPELRLLATDGEVWVDEPLADELTIDATSSTYQYDPRREPRSLAAADGVVVVVFGDGSLTRIEI